MYCKICGRKLEDKDTFCPECGIKIEKETTNKSKKKNEKVIVDGQVVVPEIQVDENNLSNVLRKDTLICIISLILMYFPKIMRYAFNFHIDLLIFPLIAWLLAIYARIKFPYCKFAKIILTIYIIQLIFFIIAVIFLIIACNRIASGCSEFGAIINLLW